ncbi:hypothetical protein O3G_MSEX001968 [Manduca sexta]|uniref:FLYWCH-type domain-containing protein n=1 Tax=Manduca sexta TaxID=7130 RepID=A0A921YMB9_MANSE|nr:hypothetical protein O3G_MSEX001968 [Manduca sexta]
MIKSQKGKDMILLDGYTYVKSSNFAWTCSKTSQCRAKVKVNAAGTVVYVDNKHTHPRRKYVLTARGIKYEIVKSQRGRDMILVDGFTFSKNSGSYWMCSNKKCKAKLKLDAKANITRLDTAHNHPTKPFIRLSDGTFVRI